MKTATDTVTASSILAGKPAPTNAAPPGASGRARAPAPKASPEKSPHGDAAEWPSAGTYEVTRAHEVILLGFTGKLYPGKLVSPRHYVPMDMQTLLRAREQLGLRRCAPESDE